MSLRRWVLATSVVTAAVYLVSSSAAAETRLEVHGGPGGSPFSSDCSGDFAVGIYLRSGVLVDAIGLKCAGFDAAQGKFKQPPWNKAYHGGNGGGDQEGLCPSGDYHVAGMKFGYTHEDNFPKYIDFVEFTCESLSGGRPITVCLQTGEGCWNERLGDDPGLLAAGRRLLIPWVQHCPPGEAAIGIHGRSGVFIDALGLICGPKPAMAIAAPPSPTTIGDNTDYPGSDYRDFETLKFAATECAVACSDDEGACKAWTWVKPGTSIGGAKGRCFLKNAVPPLVANNCCISGLWHKVKKLGSPRCTVALSVDVYDGPDGQGRKIGALAAGAKGVRRVEPCRNDWCHIKGASVPGGQGWVYSGPSYRSVTC